MWGEWQQGTRSGVVTMKTVALWGEVFQRDPDEAGETGYHALVETCRDGVLSSGWHPQCGMMGEFLTGASFALNNLRRKLKST